MCARANSGKAIYSRSMRGDRHGTLDALANILELGSNGVGCQPSSWSFTDMQGREMTRCGRWVWLRTAGRNGAEEATSTCSDKSSGGWRQWLWWLADDGG